VPGGRVDQPDGAGLIIDEIADPASAGDLVFPLLEVLAVVPLAGQVAAQSVLAVWVSCRPRSGVQDFQASPYVGDYVSAQLLSARSGVAGRKPDVPLAIRRRDGNPVPAPRTQVIASTGPKSPSVGTSAWA
jgi:hypothetical protein